MTGKIKKIHVKDGYYGSEVKNICLKKFKRQRFRAAAREK